MTIALLPRRAYRFRQLTHVRDVVARLSIRNPEPQPTVNAGRWATLPDEYTGPWMCPLDTRLPTITTPGITAPIACGTNGVVVLHLAGTWRGHVAFEGSTDGLVWHSIALCSLASGAIEGEANRPGLWRTLPGQQITLLRLRITDLSHGALLTSITPAPPAFQIARRSLDSAA